MTHDAMTTSVEDEKGSGLDEMLPVDPFRSLYVHFGMLLGVDDFRTVDAYHRGKMWFHSAWLHRAGTLWGLEVQLDPQRAEVSVAPGAALDAMGRELYLRATACLSLSAWYEAHRDDPAMVEAVTTDESNGEVSFDAHVVMRFRGCLSRQVPALREPCDGASTSTAYSRVIESVELFLKPGPAPVAEARPFHRLRLLFGLDEPISVGGEVIAADAQVLAKRDEILALPAEQQPAAYLNWMRKFSALDEMAMRPAGHDGDDESLLFPAGDSLELPLADLQGLVLSQGDAGWELVTGMADNTIRAVHLPTSTIQELLCGPQLTALAASGGTTGSGGAASVPDAGGPRIDEASVELRGEMLSMTLQGPPLMKASVDPRVVRVSAFDTRDGWITAEIKAVRYNTEKNRLSIELRDAPGGTLVRLTVKGTGETPLLGRIGHRRIPLAGKLDGAPGGLHDGNDFVYMFKTGS